MVGKVHTQGRGRVQSRAPEKNEVEQNIDIVTVQLGSWVLSVSVSSSSLSLLVLLVYSSQQYS